MNTVRLFVAVIFLVVLSIVPKANSDYLPDTADIYEIKLKEDDPTRYLYNGQWRSPNRREVTLEVKGAGPQNMTLWYSHHGPVVALRKGKAYAAKISYAQEVQVSEAGYEFNFAHDYRGAVRAMETRQLFPQNVMVADTSGNIYYQRTGRRRGPYGPSCRTKRKRTIRYSIHRGGYSCR